MLQKRRELAAAGIAMPNKRKKRNRRDIDYNHEIPFQHLVPAGFHNVGEENTRAKVPYILFYFSR